jgi:hypothetical protein
MAPLAPSTEWMMAYDVDIKEEMSIDLIFQYFLLHRFSSTDARTVCNSGEVWALFIIFNGYF